MSLGQTKMVIVDRFNGCFFILYTADTANLQLKMARQSTGKTKGYI